MHRTKQAKHHNERNGTVCVKTKTSKFNAWYLACFLWTGNNKWALSSALDIQETNKRAPLVFVVTHPFCRGAGHEDCTFSIRLDFLASSTGEPNAMPRTKQLLVNGYIWLLSRHQAVQPPYKSGQPGSGRCSTGLLLQRDVQDEQFTEWTRHVETRCCPRTLLLPSGRGTMKDSKQRDRDIHTLHDSTLHYFAEHITWYYIALY